MSDPRHCVATVLCLTALAAPASCDWSYKLDKATAGLSAVRVNGREVGAPAGITSGVLVQEVVSEKGAAVTLPAGERFARKITTATSGDALIVTVEITDTRKGDSAARVFYQLPLDASQWAWHADLSNKVSTEQSQSVYPISAASRNFAGLAVAISPETPCVFSAGLSKERGLYIEARLGLSPATNPPSRARVQFAVYSTDGEWGMRAALRQYYRLFPKAFERRATREGLWLFHGNATGLPNPTDFTFHEIAELTEAQNTGKRAGNLIRDNDLAKEKTWGIELYPYVIPGQREIAFLKEIKGEGTVIPKLAAEADGEKELSGIHYTTAEAMKVLDDATARNVTVAMTGQSLADFKQTVKNSMLIGADGDVVTRPRVVPWAGKALTFPMNPNPFIKGPLNAGSVVLEQCKRSLLGPADGVYVDSLWRWGNYLDYDKGHFAATRVGLTYGDDGRPCLDNALEHLTFLDELGKLLHPKGRKVFGNGVRPGRFWHALVMDISGAEMGAAPTETYAFNRAASYHKPYLALNHNMGKNEARDLEFLAKCILFGMYGSGDRDYYTTPQYSRTKHIYDTYLPIQRKMNKLGWEPVTAAKATQESVLVERFGEGLEFYFTLYDTTGKLTSVNIDIDCARLGLTSDSIKAVDAATEKELGVKLISGGVRVTDVPLTPQAFGVVRVTGKGGLQ